MFLVNAFISSTEPCVIGYNAALYKHVCLWLSTSQRTQIWDCVIVWNIKNIIRLYFVFWKLHSKSTWLRNLVWMGMTPLLRAHSVPLVCGRYKRVFERDGAVSVGSHVLQHGRLLHLPETLGDLWTRISPEHRRLSLRGYGNYTQPFTHKYTRALHN